jgi:nicotinate-nucleotide adenylyltransferase
MALRRVAIYGGTFDPVHNGHLEVARGVLKLFELDEILFVPACVPPHKRNASITSAYHRFAMLALATETDQRLLVSTVELDAPERPYAVDTVERLRDTERQLFFIIGADSWAELETWHEWQKLLRLCHVIVVTRPGYEVDKPELSSSVVDLRGMASDGASRVQANAEARVFLSDVAMVDVSATRIRAAAAAADTAALATMLPPAVANYIEKYNLYRN